MDKSAGRRVRLWSVVRRVVLFAFIWLAGVQTSVAQEPFTFLRANADVDAANFGDLSWIDVDRDGLQDLLVLGGGQLNGSTVNQLYRHTAVTVTLRDDDTRLANVASERLPDGLKPSSPVWLSRISWTDFDSDGFADAAVSATSHFMPPFLPYLRIYVGTGFDGMFSEQSLGVSQALGYIAWGDVNNDGLQDALVLGSSFDGEAKTSLYLNTGGQLVEHNVGLPDLRFGSAAFTDLDNDRMLDLAVCGIGPTGKYELAVFRNEGDVHFSPLPIDGEGGTHCSLDWGDYDGDGLDDLLVSRGQIGPMEIVAHADIFRNVNGARFQRESFGLVGLAGGSARFVDVDSDGSLDIIMVGGSSVAFRRALTTIYGGDGAGFRRLSNLSGVFPGSLSIGDIDDDGDVDLAIIGLDQNSQAATNIYLNAGLVVNAKPTTPGDLKATVEGGSALLSWRGATDETTPDESITYNLRIGTESEGNDVISVPVRPDGVPVRSARGNVFHNTSWRVTGLTNGNYFWSVQAIDNSLSASAFSDEATFEVTASSAGKPLPDEEIMQASSLSLKPPFPNPFKESLSIGFVLPQPGRIDVAVFDVLGRRVASLASGFVSAGDHLVTWDGRDGGENQLSSGLYLIRLAFGDESRVGTVFLRR